ncbi:hypothetical protein [Clostridium massiliamazoniense]|uniref:hypothetical protein n=1 Tax=Clostridium massiliamazoniense TaxID=1347366 RepID=UPI0006D77428|nr:hypothetical protein [Clostridium massiliamazoniense]
MAQESSFFNAELINGSYDRVYNAENWAAYFASFLSNGIAYTAQNTLLVEASNGMEVLVNTGIAFINGYRYANTTPLAVSINPANSTYNRITSIVIELNLSTRNILIKTLDGEASTNPVAPTLIQNSGVYQLQLATVLVQAGTTNICSSNITDTRSNPTVCGWLGLLMEETNEESRTLQDEISAANQSIATINSMLNINSANNSLNLNNTNFNNTVVVNDELQIAEQNGFITFENSAGKNIVDLQVNTDTFVLANAITTNNLVTVTPVTSGMDTLQVVCNTQLEGNNNFQGNSAFQGASIFNNAMNVTNNLQIAWTGSVIFQNTKGENIMCLQVDVDNNGTNCFVLQNAITNSELLSVTPVSNSSETDTLQVICNTQLEGNNNFQGISTFNNTAIINSNFQITEEGSLRFQDNKGKDMMYLQVDVDNNGTNCFVLQNAIADSDLLSVTPVASGTDTLEMWGNVNFSGDGVLQINGQQVWNGGNATSNPGQLSGQFALSDSGGQYLTYNIQYWTMNMGGVVNSTTPPECGIGVITVQLIPCSNNVDWSGSLSLTFTDLPGINGLQAMMVNQNPEFTLALNQEIEALMINNVNIVPNSNSNTPNTYTATAIILN